MKKIFKLLFMVALVVLLGFNSMLTDVHASDGGAGDGKWYIRTIESDAEGWTWNGFVPVENDKVSHSWEYGSYTAGATGEYRFKGDYLEIAGYKGLKGGTIKIEIDGDEVESISCYADEDKYKQILCKYNLVEGWHDLKITAMDDGMWHSIDYIRVNIDKQVYLKNYNLALIGDILCSVPNPTGGGNKDLNVIRNELAYEIGVSGLGPMQYDSFNGSGRGYFYMGYVFNEEIPLSRLVFQEGDTWHDGGWFADGDIKVQVRTNGKWKDVEMTNSVNYPTSDKREDFGMSCEVYSFDFKTIEGDAIRLIGMTGGSGNFVSVAQIEVYSDIEAKTLHGGYDYKKATVFEQTADDGGEDNSDSSESNTSSTSNKGKKGCNSSLDMPNSFLVVVTLCMAYILCKKIKRRNI